MSHAFSTSTAAAVPGVADHDPDPLAGAVLRSLGRSFTNRFSLGAGWAFVSGGVTFGLLPLWRLMAQFDDYVTFEKQQLTYAGEWLQTRGGGAEPSAFLDAARRLRFRNAVQWGAIVCVIIAFTSIVAELAGTFSFGRLIDHTYGFRGLPARDRSFERVCEFLCWNVGLAGAYALHWLQVRLHVRDVRRVAQAYNPVARREGVDGAAMPQFRPGLNAWWVLGAIILAALGAFWGIPLALAAAAQRRYINRTSTSLRSDIAGGVRGMLENRRPAVAVPNYMIHARRCDRSSCRAMLPAGARFCPRCGQSNHRLGEVA